MRVGREGAGEKPPREVRGRFWEKKKNSTQVTPKNSEVSH